jgi:hypothetical protein
MIAAILITTLVLFLLGVWFLIFVIDVLSSIRKACDTYIGQARENSTESSPPMPSPAPTIEQQLLRLKGHRKP